MPKKERTTMILTIVSFAIVEEINLSSVIHLIIREK